MVETSNYILALGTVGLEIATVVLVALFFLHKKVPDLTEHADIIGRYGLWVAFFITLGGSAINFYYSDVLGFEACWHCWIQRIFFSSQVVLFALALWKRDRRIADYSIALSCLGAIDALYHHTLQVFPALGLPCPSVGVSCAKITFLEFGYITYPMMAFSAFAFLIVLMLFIRRK